MVTIPRADWLDALAGAGVPPLLATELVELYDAENAASSDPAATAGNVAPPTSPRRCGKMTGR